MFHRSQTFAVLVAVAALATPPSAAQQSTRPAAQGLTGSQQPVRDNPAQQADTPPPPAGRISGRVLASDNGRPVKRARVFINAAELPGGRGMLTDDMGLFDLTDLPAGRYTMTVSKSGFVSLSYGQRRPLQAGTPLQLADGQELKGIEFRLPRGSVVSGHVFDEDGDPMPGVMVRVMRYEYEQGDRRLVPAGTSQTDDKGQYRVWGLMPGDYYVNALARVDLNLGRGGPGNRGTGGSAGGRGNPGGISAAVGRISGPQIATVPGAGIDEDQKAYTPTYFPGVTSVSEAKPIALGLSQESLDNDFGLQLIHVAKVAGRVSNPDGSPATSGQISLLPDAAVERGGQFGVNYQSRIDWDGSFSMSNVSPGRYELRARGNDTVQPQFANVPVTIGDSDISNLLVILSAGASISGTVVFRAGQTQTPDPTNIRIAAPSTEQQVGNQSQARVERDGSFTDSLPAGPHLIRPNGGLRGWTLQSVTADGRDITDVPVDLHSGQQLANVTITFTDKVNEINGTLTSDRGEPVTEYTVLSFSTDSSFWRPQSRHIATARPDQTGKFTIRTLPPGDYYLVTVDPAEQGEWFEPAYLEDHRQAASRVTLGDGDTKTHDFTIRTQ